MNKNTKNNKKIDQELEEIILKRIAVNPQKLLVVGTGITSSHLGDERNLREFLIANAIVSDLRDKGQNVVFFLFDDSYDPLNFRQLRVAVNKDEALIKKFEKYCGTPIRLIPDPYECHPSYSAHYQNEILTRFHNLGIYPTIIDAYDTYESGMYDEAKEIVFKKYKEIEKFLKKSFPTYKMKKLFYPLCPKCLMIDGVDIKRIAKGRITVACINCGHRFTESYKNIHGKFSWKIDVAAKWNKYQVDFEPFSKAYLDPDVGSYFIAKKLSEKFFGGYSPEIVSYGQIIMDKSLSYKALLSLPREAFMSFFLQNRKKDMVLSEKKYLQFAHDYKIDKDLSFYDYIVSRLPYDLLERIQGKKSAEHKYLDHGIAFASHFMGREVFPKLPTKEIIMQSSEDVLIKIRKLFMWVISYKIEYPDSTVDAFTKDFQEHIKEENIDRKIVFPVIRKLLSQEHALPMNKIFYHAPFTFLSGCLLIFTQMRIKKVKKAGKYSLAKV